MPKILVADDNSNVQRTVTLALSDYGVEVVAVNNGEAAVRKLADFTPDLILADIFMPVRNGYEVCEYVKHAPKFAQTPVVLLVGAFDPFDEREAQRVGADGILKKPFVPPDPLIAMVRTLLDRVMASRPVPAAVAAGPAAITQRTVNNSVRKVYPSVEEAPEESPVPEVAAQEHVAFGKGQRPVAFEDMFETPAAKVEASSADATAVKDDAQILTSKRDSALGDPGFWRKDEEDAEPAFESALASERDAQTLERPWEPAIPATVASAETAEAPPDSSKASSISETSFELVREIQEEGVISVIPDSILQDPAAVSTLSVEAGKPENLAANPLDWMASAPPSTTEAVRSDEPVEAEPVAAVEAPHEVAVKAPLETPILTPVVASTETSTGTLEVAPVIPPVSVPADVVAPKSAEPVSEAPIDSVQPVVLTKPLEENKAKQSSDSEAEKTVQAKTDTPDLIAPVRSEKWANLEDVMPEQTKAVIEAPKPEPVKSTVVKPASPPVFKPLSEPTIAAKVAPPAAMRSEKWSDLEDVLAQQPKSATETSKQEAIKSWVLTPSATPVVEPTALPKAVPPPLAAEAVNSSPSVTPDPAVVEAVVQRVLEKMSPQVIDIITREFLRPVVQALVKREVEKH